MTNPIEKQVVPQTTTVSTNNTALAAMADEDDFELPVVACFYRPGDPEFEGCESCQ